MTDSNNIEWQHTDPDNHQYGRMIREGVYEFKEYNRKEYSVHTEDHDTEEDYIDSVFDDSTFWIQDTISLVDYSEQEIEDHISGYYDSLDHLKEIYGQDWMFITAECIFEQESGLY